MFLTATDAANWIMSLKNKKNLAEFKAVLDEIGMPYEQLPCIHITGTNGKGSTLNYIRSILNEAGYRVGTFTSPYIICHQDRFCIDGKMMSDEDFVRIVNQYQPIIEKYQLSMFESDVLLMLAYFMEKQVDIVLVEVGIGARRDKTNIVLPKASIITNVGNDHLASLGPTLKDVAYQKAGIIKENTPIFVSEMEPSLIDVIKKEADLKHAKLHVVKASEFKGETMNFDFMDETDLKLGDVASYQIKNACLAIAVIKEIYPDVTSSQIKAGLVKAFWPGRFEKFVVGGVETYLDGAHNSSAFEALFEAIERIRHGRKVTVIYAALADKEYKLMAQMIKDMGYALQVTHFADDRAMSIEQANEISSEVFYHSIDEAIENIPYLKDFVVVCGSLHFISQFREKLLEKI